MANTLDGMMPDIYKAMALVGRTPIGLIGAVNTNSGAEQSAVGEVVKVPVATVAAAQDIAPSMTGDATKGNASVGYTPITLTKQREVPINWNGEETKGIQNGGMFENVTQQQFYLAFKTLSEEVESDIARELKLNTLGSHVYGTAGTTPFGTAGNLSDIAELARILTDAGCPEVDRHFVINTATMAKLGGVQSVLFKANEAGTDDLLRKGVIGELENFLIHKSGQLLTHTKGTGASYVTNLAAALAKGAKSIAIDTGSGTVLAGDIITFADDLNRYLVNTGVTEAGSIAINEGLMQTLADAKALTIGANYRPNFAFERSAIVLAARAPASPKGGDAATDVTYVTDTVSGLTFEIRVYKGERMNQIKVGLVWGVKVLRPEHTAMLIG